MYCCWPKCCLLREQKNNPFSNIIAHSSETASSENATCNKKNQLSLFWRLRQVNICLHNLERYTFYCCKEWTDMTLTGLRSLQRICDENIFFLAQTTYHEKPSPMSYVNYVFRLVCEQALSELHRLFWHILVSPECIYLHTYFVANNIG